MSCYIYSTLIVIWSVLPVMIVGFLEVSLKREIVTYVIGQNATLSCRFKNTIPMGRELIRVLWEKVPENFEVPEIIFDNKDKGLVGREQEFQGNWQFRGKVMNRFCSRNPVEGETKLRIVNLTEQMWGKYRCLEPTGASTGMKLHLDIVKLMLLKLESDEP
uniref:Ig-like domain-containing protein n=1 Tax=Strigops habroptila TaxID=2489341 RepID=A0A672US18_STRHB